MATLPSPNSPHTKSRHIGRNLIQLAGVGIIIAGALNYQAIIDEYALATYKPAAAIEQLWTPVEPTRQATALMYRSQPQIDAKNQFNTSCQTEKGLLELGCYSSGRIYLLNIDHDGLEPEMQVVLAHEVLHAAWQRTSQSERERLTSLLQQAYGNLKASDPALVSRMAEYARSEPGEEANELHSILGTEYRDLPSGLEDYYRRYFGERSKIVAAHEQYEAVFNKRRVELDSQLATIKSLKSQLTTLNARMDRLKSSGQVAAYNALVPSQNAQVERINQLIESYDKAVDEYNALAKSLDSNELSSEPGL